MKTEKSERKNMNENTMKIIKRADYCYMGLKHTPEDFEIYKNERPK